jgi:hypothetical protein
MLAKPFGAVFSLIFGLIVLVPGAVERRQRLGGNVRPPPDAAVDVPCWARAADGEKARGAARPIKAIVLSMACSSKLPVFEALI